jgi:hypothetical protein
MKLSSLVTILETGSGLCHKGGMNFTPSEKDGNHRCPYCKALYKIARWGTTPARDSDMEICSYCGEQMAVWNATSYPIFELIGECPKQGKSPNSPAN